MTIMPFEVFIVLAFGSLGVFSLALMFAILEVQYERRLKEKEGTE